MVTGPVPLCESCKHFNWSSHSKVWTCAAFPKEIPFEIMSWEFDHHEPYPDDNGIQYEKRKVS
jgi:hypothetical protein